MSEKLCSTCLYNFDHQCEGEQCLDYSGWRPKYKQPITFVDKIKEALPKDYPTMKSYPSHGDGGPGLPDNSGPLILPEESPLDKLINDHWYYVEDTLNAHCCSDKDIEIARHHYMSAFRHGFKHCMEHYGIEEKNDD